MLEFDGLTKRYGRTVALQDRTFAVRPGELYGMRWRGRPVTFETRRRFGSMPEERGLYPKMRVVEQLVYFARLHGLVALVRLAGWVYAGAVLRSGQRVKLGDALAAGRQGDRTPVG